MTVVENEYHCSLKLTSSFFSLFHMLLHLLFSLLLNYTNSGKSHAGDCIVFFALSSPLLKLAEFLPMPKVLTMQRHSVLWHLDSAMYTNGLTVWTSVSFLLESCVGISIPLCVMLLVISLFIFISFFFSCWNLMQLMTLNVGVISFTSMLI